MESDFDASITCSQAINKKLLHSLTRFLEPISEQVIKKIAESEFKEDLQVYVKYHYHGKIFTRHDKFSLLDYTPDEFSSLLVDALLQSSVRYGTNFVIVDEFCDILGHSLKYPYKGFNQFMQGFARSASIQSRTLSVKLPKASYLNLCNLVLKEWTDANSPESWELEFFRVSPSNNYRMLLVDTKPRSFLAFRLKFEGKVLDLSDFIIAREEPRVRRPVSWTVIRRKMGSVKKDEGSVYRRWNEGQICSRVEPLHNASEQGWPHEHVVKYTERSLTVLAINSLSGESVVFSHYLADKLLKKSLRPIWDKLRNAANNQEITPETFNDQGLSGQLEALLGLEVGCPGTQSEILRLIDLEFSSSAEKVSAWSEDRHALAEKIQSQYKATVQVLDLVYRYNNNPVYAQARLDLFGYFSYSGSVSITRNVFLRLITFKETWRKNIPRKETDLEKEKKYLTNIRSICRRIGWWV